MQPALWQTDAHSQSLQVEAQDLVVDGMKEVFGLHGASPMASTGMGVAPADWAPDAVSLLGPCGDPWGLRYDLRHPFVAWLARQASLLTTSTCDVHPLSQGKADMPPPTPTPFPPRATPQT